MRHELMTPDEVANKLRARAGTLQWWRTMGRGPRYVKIGRHVFYRASDLDQFISAGERVPAEAV